MNCYKVAPIKIGDFREFRGHFRGIFTARKMLLNRHPAESWGLIMAGGMQPGGPNNWLINQASVWTTDDGLVFEPLPDMPAPNKDFCVVIVDDDRIFACGGEDAENNSLLTDRTLLFQKSTNTWER